MQRRSFLIQASGIMAGLWAGSTFLQPAEATAQDLSAQPLSTPPKPNPSKPSLKKRAILLGIAQNPEKPVTAEVLNDLGLNDLGLNDLVLNDLLLQKQLLQLRYGFSESDIVQLTADEVTIAQVTTTIEQHLMGADVGVLHFSGLLRDASALQLDDGVLSLTTLAEQLKLLKIPHLTTVLDLKNLGANPNTAIPIEIPATFPGLLVQTRDSERDYNRSPINAQGSLTQAWTQALWNSEKITVNLSAHSPTPWKLTGDRKNESAYFITALQPLGAGAVQQSENNQTLVWLGGLAPEALALIGPGSILQVKHDRRIEHLQVIDRQDRSATVTAIGSVAMGDPILESVRRIPRKLGLTLILGETLSKIETVDAISALSDVKSIDILKQDAKAIVPKNADYILTQLNPTSNPISNSSRNIDRPNHHYGLVSADTQDLIPGTWGEASETVKVAVQRLRPKLRSLQARKQLRMTLHSEATSVASLALKATLNRVHEKNNSLQPIQTFPNTSNLNKSDLNRLDLSNKPSIQSGDRLRYEIQNLGQATLYWLLWQWDSNLTGTIVLPPVASNLGFISGGAYQPVMSGIARPDWTVRTAGKTESFLICSSNPFTTTYRQLVPIEGDDGFVHSVSDPLAVMEALLTDLQGNMQPVSETYALDLAQSITLPFHYEVAA